MKRYEKYAGKIVRSKELSKMLSCSLSTINSLTRKGLPFKSHTEGVDMRLSHDIKLFNVTRVHDWLKENNKKYAEILTSFLESPVPCDTCLWKIEKEVEAVGKYGDYHFCREHYIKEYEKHSIHSEEETLIYESVKENSDEKV